MLGAGVPLLMNLGDLTTLTAGVGGRLPALYPQQYAGAASPPVR